MKCYVARDKDGELWMFTNMPCKYGSIWNGRNPYEIDQTLFPDLKWEDEPIEVELILKEVTD